MFSYGTGTNTRYNLQSVRKPRSLATDGKLMVTVLVEKREFSDKPGSASRLRRNVKSAAELAAAQPPATDPPAANPPGAAVSSSSAELSASDRYRQIRVFAYYKAEQRGFAPGHMWDDWLAAEREVNARNSGGPVKAPDPGS